MLISTHGSCERGDLLRQPQHQGRTAISTHAPTGGATVLLTARNKTIPHFYSRPHGRGDGIVPPWGRGYRAYFYSRPHGRGDAVSHSGHFSLIYFYSRPHGRGDAPDDAALSQRLDFYSRPHGRGDDRRGYFCRSRVISTRAPTGGATLTPSRSRENSRGISTRAPTGGATEADLDEYLSTYFISTRAPTGGAT